MNDLAVLRLRNQRLTGEPFASAVAAVRRLGAVQSQDYAGAKWALGQRTAGLTDAELDRLFDQGAILRTHVLRPTWHFVLPEDVRWLLGLTGPRVLAGVAGRHRRLEIDGAVIARALSAFSAALEGGRHLTRLELGAVLRAAGIAPEGQRLPHLLLCAELKGLLVSGPRHGKQMSWALLEERVPAARPRDREEALAELATRYFRGHGPAQLQDFVWWSGLRLADARAALELAGGALDRRVVDGKDHWSEPGAWRPGDSTGVAHLLPNFDEYTVGYRDRTALLPSQRPFDSGLFSFGTILSNVLTIAGEVRGAWRRTAAQGGRRVEVRRLDGLEAREREAVEGAACRLGRFLERRLEVVWV